MEEATKSDTTDVDSAVIKLRSQRSMERKDVWSDLLNEEEAHRKLSIGIFDIWALGLTIVIGGQYFSWNNGLSSGFGSFTLSTFLIGTAYICLCLCNAEISSSLPFAGGAYGLARVIFGLFPGFLIGCCEAVEYIVYVAASVITLCDMIASITRSTEEIALLYILLFYISALFIHIKGGPLFWRSNTVLAILSLLLLLIFCLGALPWANLAANGPAESTSGSSGSEWFVGGFPMFVRAMPQAAWFYVGVESLNLGIGFVEEPRRVLPRGSMLCVLTLFFTSMFVLFVSASLPPLQEGDVLAKQLTPFNNGYLRMFRGISYDMATMLSIPATYATAFGFIFSFGRVILSMARSRLLPPIFARTYGDYKTPYAAMIGGSLLGFSLCVIAFLVPTIRKQLFNWCFLPALCTYICQCIGYIIYKIQYPNQERLFVSPLGIYGAIYSATVFAFAAISEAGFQKDNFVGLILFLGSIALYAVYYFSYARMKQVFSAEEKFVYMKLIVKYHESGLLAYTRKKQAMHRRSVIATKKRIIGYIERKSSLSFGGDRKQSRVAALDSSIHGSRRRSEDGLLVRQGSLSASIHDGSVNIDAAAAATGADADLGCSRHSVDEGTIRVYGRRYTITPSTIHGSSSNLLILQRQSSTIVHNNQGALT